MTRDVPLPVQLAVAGPTRQRRWTVLIRLIMLIPHYFVLYFLNIAFGVVAFIGWWGALFTGQLPGFAVSFLSGFMRWSMRVQAYGLMLTDHYPPFSLDDEPGYPVRIAIPPRDRLNRAAVLFRIILAIPASLLTAFVLYGGATIVAFIAWLIALITGKLPTSLHLAYTAILRYTARFYCYFYLLTAAYPRGLFGDDPAVPPVGDFNPAAPGYGTPATPGPGTPGYGAPGYGAPGYGVPGYGVPGYGAPGYGAPGYGVPGYGAPGYGVPGYGAPGYGAPGYGAPGYGIPVDPAALQPADWRLLLTRGAKQLLGWFIGIGAVIWVAYIVVAAISGYHQSNVITTRNAIAAVNAANKTLASELNSYQSTIQACTSAACAEKADAQAATAFGNFASKVHGTSMPGSAVAPASRVYSDATEVSKDLTRLSHLSPTISASQYESTANGLGLVQASDQLQQDFNALTKALNSSR
jgi:hypothetical protein